MTAPRKRTPAEIGRANLAKSKECERALVAYLRNHGWPGAERTVRTGYQTAERTSRDRGDVDGTPGLVWQAKAVADAKLHLVPTWLAETEQQRQAANADFGVLVVKRAGRAHPASWWAYLFAYEFARLAGCRSVVLARNGHLRLELGTLLPWLHLAGYGTPPPETAELPVVVQEAS